MSIRHGTPIIDAEHDDDDDDDDGMSDSNASSEDEHARTDYISEGDYAMHGSRDHDEFDAEENIMQDIVSSGAFERDVLPRRTSTTPINNNNSNSNNNGRHGQSRCGSDGRPRGSDAAIPSYLETTAYGPLRRHQLIGYAGSDDLHGSTTLGASGAKSSGNNLTCRTNAYTNEPFIHENIFDVAPDLDPIGGTIHRAPTSMGTTGFGLVPEIGHTPQPAGSRISQSLFSMLKGSSERSKPSLSLPTCWNSTDMSQNIKVSNNGLDLTYIGPGKRDEDAGMIRANKPITRHCGVFYYEVEITSRGQSGYIGIGFCRSNVKLERLPGWDSNSWGYH
ncbi:hypothetical protein EV182_005338, partial [Spiromyces aspiralis]